MTLAMQEPLFNLDVKQPTEKELIAYQDMIRYEEMDLFKNICVAIAGKDIDINSHQLTQYASEVCDKFSARYLKK